MVTISVKVLGVLLLGVIICFGLTRAEDNDDGLAFSQVLTNYDKNRRPGFGTTNADICEFSIVVYQIGPVSEATMSLTTDMYLRQTWKDKRVTDAVAPLFEEMPASNKSRFISLTKDMANQLWKPNVYFKDAIQEKTPQEVSQSQFLRVYENGNILSSKRVLLTTRCAIGLRFFPLDLQLCPICIESYELDDSEQLVKWKEEELRMSDQSTATFTVDNDVTLTSSTKYYSDLDTYYTNLCMEVRLARKLTMYIVTMYLPSVALVILSWVSFWIDKKAVPARAGLTITTILAQITLITGTANKFPGIADLKLGDTYMIVNFFFVFGSLIEFAMVSGQEQHRMRSAELAKAEENKQLLENKDKGEDGESQNGGVPKADQGNFLQRVYKEKFKGDIDLVARRLFPLCFTLWNILYFALGFGLRTYKG